MPDGLQVVAVQDPSAAVVSIVMAIDGGRANEPAAGLSRAVAQTWFTGEATPVSTVAEMYDRIGATTSVSVTPEATVFTTRVPSAGVGDALLLEWFRFSGALKGVEALAPVTHEASVEEYRSKYLDSVYRSLYSEGHRYGSLYADPVSEHPLYVASAWVGEAWRPDRATLVIVSPKAPDAVLCALEPTACTVDTPEVVEAPLELPEPTMKVVSEAVRGQQVGPLSVGVDPTLLLGWALPGTDVVGAQLVEYVRQRVADDLSSAVSGSRCLDLELGREATTLVCTLPPDTERATVDKALRKGWSQKKLGKDVERWRSKQLGQLVGSTADADFAERLALHMRSGGTPAPYAGSLEDLAFGEEQVVVLLEGAASYDSASWIRLEP